MDGYCVQELSRAGAGCFLGTTSCVTDILRVLGLTLDVGDAFANDDSSAGGYVQVEAVSIASRLIAVQESIVASRISRKDHMEDRGRRVRVVFVVGNRKFLPGKLAASEKQLRSSAVCRRGD
jgi:hypothetical protein